MSACKTWKRVCLGDRTPQRLALTDTHRVQINRARDVLGTHTRLRSDLLSFHLNAEHTSLALCKDEGWNTKDVYRWCQQSLCLPPSHSFKSSTGLGHRGSWVFPPSHQLTFSLSLSFFLPLPPSSSSSCQGRCQETSCAAPPED